MKSKTIKQISVFLCLTMLATLMFSAPISAETGSAIISILSGDEIALGETLKVSADIPSFTNKAELYLDDTSVAEISEEDTDATYIFSATVPESETIGTKTIKLVVDGEIADTAVVEVYKKTMHGSNNWYQDFDTGFTEDSADSVAFNTYSSNLTTDADGYVDGMVFTENAEMSQIIQLVPNSTNFKYYVGSLNGDKAMIGQYAARKTGSAPYFYTYFKNTSVLSGLIEFSFNISVPQADANPKITFGRFRTQNNGKPTASFKYDIINNANTVAGALQMADSLIAAGETMVANKEYNVKFSINLDTKEYKILLDNVLCQTGVFSDFPVGETMNNIKVTFQPYGSNWTDLRIFMDDLKAINYSTSYAPKVTSLSCDEETLVLSDAVIEVGAETITAVMDTELSSATAYIADATGKKIADAVVSGDTVTIDGSAITKDGEYAIVVNSTVSQASAKTLIPFKAYYVGAEGFLVGTSLEIDGNDVHGYFEAVNSGEASQNVKFIVCTYNDNELLDLTILPLEVKAGDKADEKVEFIDSSANHAKVMLWWDSLTEITPIIDYEYAAFRTQQ